MMTVDRMREAWTYALTEIDAAISYIEVEGLDAEPARQKAAQGWLTTLHRDQTEYRALLDDHPTMQSNRS